MHFFFKQGYVKWIVMFLASITFLSCHREVDRPNWDTDILVPVLKTTLGVRDILSDTSYTLGRDSSIFLVFEKILDSIGLNVIDTLSVPPYYRSFGLTSVTFPQKTFSKTITLGQLATQLALSSDTTSILAGIIILTNQGSSIQIKSIYSRIKCSVTKFNPL